MSEVPAPTIAAQALHALLGQPGVVVVDCRFILTEPDAGRLAYADGHIPGAVYAHLDHDLSRPPGPHEGRHPLPEPAAFTATLARLGITRDSLVVACDDQSGAIAARLWWMLQWIGHPHCSLLDGGMQAWTAAGLPLDKGTVVPHAASYPPCAPDDSLIATTAQMLQFSGVLLDARAGPRFRGEVEPIDPVAGHIPGAQNLQFADLLGPDGRFLAAAALEQRIARALPRTTDRDGTEIVAMCGSGVTACHLIAGLALTGRRSRLYVGSWSEWIRDPQRPVANVD